MKKHKIEQAGRDDIRNDIKAEDIPDLKKTKAEIEVLREEQEQLKNQLKRAVADYDNLEKRVMQRAQEVAIYASAELIKKIIPIMDNLEKALLGMSEEEKQSGWAKGVEISIKQLREVLKNEGLEQIRADGQFDPALHEAVDTKDGENDKILEVVERGYKLNGKIIKPARVVVGRRE